ncbi:erythromycin esterase family protein [Paenibacillus sp.]|jgi:erythromycin esterase|uniref:erythromycin esterase family protein n=1 Tax=Paenibacillus sp. TaxID=58172 RepID=UPI0028293178|nr:erythromycin esterase family protein [Paenibacillus sp.]MDR0269490.1 erythromycin esterase family protein [Paenibacillus sp.]
MTDWKRKLTVSVMVLAILSSSWMGAAAHAMENKAGKTANKAVCANQDSMWKEWIKKNAKPIAKIGANASGKENTAEDTYKDLQFFKTLLKDKRMVSLGEASHGASEYNLAKVRLVKFLHEQMGYDVLAFESNLADTTIASVQINHDKPQDTMEKSIFGVWHVQENLPLFEYIAQQSRTDHPLILTGVDVQGTSKTFITFVENWFGGIDQAKAKEFAETERWFAEMHAYNDLDQFNREQPQLIEKYRMIQQFVKENEAKLKQSYPKNPELIPSLKRVLENRIDMLDTYMIHMVKLFAQMEPEYHIQEASYIRDLQMANNAAWLAERLYPDKKIIVWGHNYHVRKHNSTMITEHNGFDFNNHPYPTMGEMLPYSVKKNNYVIGLYTYQGSSNLNNGKVESVHLPHKSGSMEDILKAGGHPVSFVDLTGAKLEPSTSWMFTPRIAKAWGMLEESMILRDQYDGLLFVDTIHPSKRLSK